MAMATFSQLALHFADYQRSSPHCRQLIFQASLSNCSPSPCGRLSLPRTTTGTPPAHRASGSHSLGISDGPSPVHMSDSNVLVRLPVAVFTLACRKSMRSSRSSYALPEKPCPSPYICDEHSGGERYMCPSPARMPPIKSCRWRRHFSPQTRMNRFVFLNLPILSLEVHLGVTTSPHTPFPTGYVTLPMYGRSPPLRLSLPRSR
jgi:hypothetical protein